MRLTNACILFGTPFVTRIPESTTFWDFYMNNKN